MRLSDPLLNARRSASTRHEAFSFHLWARLRWVRALFSLWWLHGAVSLERCGVLNHHRLFKAKFMGFFGTVTLS